MVIVAGHLIVDPSERAAYLAGCAEVVRRARGADGCLDFSIGADLVDDRRVNVLERWESREAVEAFRGGGPGEEQTAAIRGGSVSEHDVAGSRPLL